METNNYWAVPSSAAVSSHPPPPTHSLLKRKLAPEPPKFPGAEEEAGIGSTLGTAPRSVSLLRPHPVNQPLIILTGCPRVSLLAKQL